MEMNRPFKSHNSTYILGRSYFYICCPYCNAQTKVYKWSFAGHGKKKCSRCEAIHKPDGYSHLDIPADLRIGDRIVFFYAGHEMAEIKGHAFEGEIDMSSGLTWNEICIKFWPLRGALTPACYVLMHYVKFVMKMKKVN